MGESKFWKPEGVGFGFNGIVAKLKSLFSFGKNKSFVAKDTQFQDMSKPVGKFGGVKKLYKGLGVFGGVILVVFGILALVLFIFVVKPAYSVKAQVDKLTNDRLALEKAVKSQDLVGVHAALDQFDKDISDLRGVRDSNFPWANSLGISKPYYEDSEHFINAGLYAIDAVREFATVVEPFSEAAGFKPKDVVISDPNAPSGLAEAVATWVRVMPEVADKMDGVIAKVDMVGDEFSKVDPKRYPESIRGIAIKSNIEAAQMYLSRASEFGPDIKAALTVIPPVLGLTGEKRYGIIMQNSAEIRATGGFWTNFASFRLRNALLNSDFSSKDMYSFDHIISLTDTAYTQPWPAPYPPYRDFLKVEHTFARDSNFSPDFVNSIDAFMKFYRQVGYIAPDEAKPLNGIFAIDTTVLSELMKVTGPVTLGGVVYDSESVILELEKLASLSLQEQVGRKKVLGDLMEAMLVKMYESERNLWPKFIETGVRLGVEKHALAYVFDDPKAQELIEKYNFGGRIVKYDKGDFSYVVSTNLGGDKNNLFITRSVTHNIVEEGGKWIHEVLVDFTFNKPKPGYEPLVSVYRDWVRVYAPAGSTLVAVEGSQATTTIDTGEDSGKVYFAGYVTVAPDEKKTIKFRYQIPTSVVGVNVYNLYLEKQPGTDADTHVVNFKGKSQTIELKTDKEVIFRF